MDKNFKLLKEAIEYAKQTGSFNALNLIDQADNVCIWGAGRFFAEAYERYFLDRNVKVHYVVDSNSEKWGKVFLGVLCISPQQLYDLSNVVVIPLLTNGYSEVVNECRKRKIKWVHPIHCFFDMHAGGNRSIEWFCQNSYKIEEVYNMLQDDESKRIYANVVCNRIANELSQVGYKELYSENEYFSPQGLYTLGENEYLADIGAFDGDSIQDFLETVDYNFGAIYSLEMSHVNYSKLERRVSAYKEEVREKINCFNVGAWNEEVELVCGEETCNTGEGCSIYKGEGGFLKEEESMKVKCFPLDKLLEDKKITLIKMDIEGAEQQALDGARQIIMQQKPKLAICIYHSVNHLWDIPFMIKKMVPDYKFAVRHHTFDIGDTVCYAYLDM